MANRFHPYLTPALGIVAIGLFALNLHQYVRHIVAPGPPVTYVIKAKPHGVHPPTLPLPPKKNLKRYEFRYEQPDATERFLFEFHRNEARTRSRDAGLSKVVLSTTAG